MAEHRTVQLTPACFLGSKRTYCAFGFEAVKRHCYQRGRAILQRAEMSLKSRNWLVKMKGYGSFLGEKWLWQSTTKNQLPVINAVGDRKCQAWLQQQSHQKHKKLVAFPTKKKKSTIFIVPPSSVTLPHTQHWPFSLNWVTLSGGEELWKITLYRCVAVFQGTQKDWRDHLSVDSLKEKERQRKKLSLPDVFSLFFMRHCLPFLYLPFISASLALLVGWVSGKQSLSPSLWCFCRLQRAFEATALLIARASDRPMPSVRLTAK